MQDTKESEEETMNAILWIRDPYPFRLDGTISRRGKAKKEEGE